jgi:hypothetical protein
MWSPSDPMRGVRKSLTAKIAGAEARMDIFPGDLNPLF